MKFVDEETYNKRITKRATELLNREDLTTLTEAEKHIIASALSKNLITL